MFSKSLKDFFKNPIITLPNFIYLGITQLLIFLLFRNITDNSLYYNLEFDPQAAATIALSFLLFIIINLFLTPFILSWTALMAKRAVDGEKPSFIDDFKESLKYYWRVLGAAVLVGFIIFSFYTVMLIILAITFGLSFLTSPEQLTASSGIGAILLITVFVLGVIFLSVAMSPIQTVLVYDDLNVGDAFSKGFKLGAKKFFPILGCYLLSGLFAGLIVLFLTLILGKNSIAREIISSLLYGYFTVLPTIFVLNLYSESKSGKEHISNINCTDINNSETYEQWKDIYNKNELSKENPQTPENEEENRPNDSNFRI